MPWYIVQGKVATCIAMTMPWIITIPDVVNVATILFSIRLGSKSSKEFPDIIRYVARLHSI